MNALKVEVQELEGRNVGKKHHLGIRGGNFKPKNRDVPSVRSSILEGHVRAELKDVTHVGGVTTWLVIVPKDLSASIIRRSVTSQRTAHKGSKLIKQE